MPPTPTVNREEILDAAVSLVRLSGIDGVNARSPRLLAELFHEAAVPGL